MKFVYLIITILGVLYILGNFIGLYYAAYHVRSPISVGVFYWVFFMGFPFSITIICGYLSYKKFKSKN